MRMRVFFYAPEASGCFSDPGTVAHCAAGDEPERFRRIQENRISLAVLNLDEPEKTCCLLKDSCGLSVGRISRMAGNEYSQK